ncbi:MAG TPA: T9SS type A sorting domain-containing protein [Flavipsychrobacter sp.]|nr:T9SS type A sorting domain-containing protein [Flavipsychrobacter sp.]
MKKLILLLLSCGLWSTVNAQTYVGTTCGTESVIALRSDSTLWGWGNNGNYELGYNSFSSVDTPVQIASSQKWIYAAMGSFHTMAIASDSTLWGWGFDLVGSIGKGVFDTSSLSVQVNTSHWRMVSCGMAHSVALRNDGTLWATGYNLYGQLGTGDTATFSSFKQIDADNDWKTVSAGGLHTLAIKKNGTLWAWGYNVAGQLGNGTTVTSLVPIQIGTDTNWVAISGGFEFSLALKSDGTVWSWGYNQNSQLGRGAGTILYDSLPRQISGLNNVASISAGSVFAFVIKKDGTLWGWGFNQYGDLGMPALPSVDTPTQVDSSTTWKHISAAQGFIAGGGVVGLHAAGFKTSATAICTAGANYIGQLGSGTSATQQEYFGCTVGEIPTTAVATVSNHTDEVSLYPNPANEMVYLKLPDNTQFQSGYAEIINVNGQVCLKQLLTSRALQQLDVHNLAAGYYFVNINDASGNMYHLKFTKQ